VQALITGAQGQLGRDLGLLLPEATSLGKQELSIVDLDAVRQVLSKPQPEVVFNCAAYNAVDAAESDPTPAQAVNAQGAENLAVACREVGARLVHFSTNYVFDGDREQPYSEEDEPNPQSAYARSKREGEILVLSALPSALVIRSSGLYGHAGSAIKGGSFPDRILSRARAGQPLKVVDDQWLNPTFTGDLAAGALGLVNEGMEGVVHLVAGDCCSWWEFAVETVHLAGLDVEVTPVSSDQFPAPAARPRHGCLRSVRTPHLRDWRQALTEFFESSPSTADIPGRS
jgi:dTDP-4-dehydrorhamnose reductase